MRAIEEEEEEEEEKKKKEVLPQTSATIDSVCISRRPKNTCIQQRRA